jgi:hypothetical protein
LLPVCRRNGNTFFVVIPQKNINETVTAADIPLARSQNTYVDDKEVSLLGTSPEKSVKVYDVSGNLQIHSAARVINMSELPSGLYLVNVNGQTRRVMKR